MDLNSELPATLTSMFGDVLDLPVELASGPTRSVHLSSCVHITGGWNGIIVISTCQESSKSVAAILLDSPEAELSPDDEVDSMAEFANVLGGNIKGMFEGQSRLTLPVISVGGGILVPSAKSTSDCTVCLPNGGELTVSLFQNSAMDTLADEEQDDF